jgi:hypothetical protein
MKVFRQKLKAVFHHSTKIIDTYKKIWWIGTFVILQNMEEKWLVNIISGCLSSRMDAIEVIWNKMLLKIISYAGRYSSDVDKYSSTAADFRPRKTIFIQEAPINFFLQKTTQNGQRNLLVEGFLHLNFFSTDLIIGKWFQHFWWFLQIMLLDLEKFVEHKSTSERRFQKSKGLVERDLNHPLLTTGLLTTDNRFRFGPPLSVLLDKFALFTKLVC